MAILMVQYENGCCKTPGHCVARRVASEANRKRLAKLGQATSCGYASSVAVFGIPRSWMPRITPLRKSKLLNTLLGVLRGVIGRPPGAGTKIMCVPLPMARETVSNTLTNEIKRGNLTLLDFL